MKVVKEQSEFGTNIHLLEKDKYVTFSFCGNLDLYWSIHSKEKKYKFNEYNKDDFIITKENYNVYNLFEFLFDDINDLGKEYDSSNLYDKKSNTITWYSDETNRVCANYLRIIKEDEIFRLEFNTQPYKEGYDRDFGTSTYIPIRFRNSGSSYLPFNISFMKMYKKMDDLDDVNEYGHQIHIEEYLYNKKLTLKN